MKLIKLCLVFLLLVVVGCKGPKGDTGSAGQQGDTGDTGTTGSPGDTGDTGTTGSPGEKGEPGENAEFEVYTGTIPGSGLVAFGSGTLPSNAHVTVWYAFPGSPNVWGELGEPDSVLGNPWCAVSYSLSAVYFYNYSTTWLYKIIVMTPSLAPPLSAKGRFNYFDF